MKSVEEFWEVIAVYNGTFLWLQSILVALLVIFTIACYLYEANNLSVILKAILASCFVFIGIVFFIVSDNSSLGRFLGAPIYISIAIMFVIDIWWKRVEFRFPEKRRMRILVIVLFTLYFAYPLVSYLIGHIYPKTVLYLMPCPLVYFTTILLSTNIRKTNLFIYSLLIFWGITGLPKAIFGAYEDLILLISGIYALVLFITNFKHIVLHNKIVFMKKSTNLNVK